MTEVIWRVPNKQIETNSQLSALYMQTMFPFVSSVAIFYISILYFVNSFSNKSHEKTKTPNALVFEYLSLLESAASLSASLFLTGQQRGTSSHSMNTLLKHANAPRPTVSDGA